MRHWPVTGRRVLRLWPEALLGVITVLIVAMDGLRQSGGDPSYYYHIAQQVSQGLVPYRDFPFEYPPVSLPAVLLPYYLPGGSSLDWYLGFLSSGNVAMMTAIAIAVGWLAARGWSAVPWPRSAAICGLLSVSLAPVVVWRFDALPTLLTVLALVAVALRRPVGAGVALGAAIVGKLYPLAMLPALLVGQVRNRSLRSAFVLGGATIVTAAVIMAPFVLFAGAAAFYPIDYATGRSVQIESTAGALAVLADVLGGPSTRIYQDFGTWQVDSPLLAILGPLWTGLTVILIGTLGLALWHRFRLDRRSSDGLQPLWQVTHILAALMVVLVTSRVFSPQYLLWAVPFVALGSRPKSLFFWSACLLTMYVYTLSYQALLDREITAVVAINVRNVMLVAFLAWVIAPDLRGAIGELAGRVRPTTVPSG